MRGRAGQCRLDETVLICTQLARVMYLAVPGRVWLCMAVRGRTCLHDDCMTVQ